MLRLLKATEFAKKLGISVRTLDRRIEDGTIVPSLVKNNRRYFTTDDIDKYLGKEVTKQSKISIAYTRVSSSSQKGDLDGQEKYIDKYSGLMV